MTYMNLGIRDRTRGILRAVRNDLLTSEEVDNDLAFHELDGYMWEMTKKPCDDVCRTMMNDVLDVFFGVYRL